jgi:hypothetical protein
MSKNITVIPATGGPYKDLQIDPGTTVGDIRLTLGLSPQHVLTRGQGAEPIPEGENLYETLSDGAKLYSTTPVEWGGGILDWLFAPPQKPEPLSYPKIYRPAGGRIRKTYRPVRAPNSARIRHGIPVARQPRPYWVERGWKCNGIDYSGLYRTDFGSWSGWIRQSPSGRVEAYIAQPPATLKRHPHWPCFRPRSDGWFFIHAVTEVPDVSAAILAVENTLDEAADYA